MKKLIIISLLFLGFNKLAIGSEAFGPYESRLIFEGDKKSITYRINNTGKLTWLVQGWIEDLKEVKTKDFTVVPTVFRVEPNSQFTARVVKNSNLPEDRETLFWVVSNSLPGGDKEERKELKEGTIQAKLSLAYRYKVPMYYRPAGLKNIAQRPDMLEWRSDKNGKISVYNPTKYSVQIQYVYANGVRNDGKGVSYIIPPMTGSELRIKSKHGEKIKYGIINDYGTVKEYEGVIK
ncbi:fimbrial biogenesis chaperone [Escherichia coli]|uniref:fimbrial biogenesis chaperone n=1 Tax=Escherichia coli TaxID=562 RepID=UPI0002A1A36E|nr:molecular chaperone [Escherichia coli]ELG03280.1 hypothetical protein A1S5_00018 [Escherichia coli KTE48]MDY1736297.1 molecular chaperone [Klebsiella pneumoniae]